MIKAVLISDTHGKHSLVSQGEGDLLLHAGDLTNGGSIVESDSILKWLENQKKYYTHVVFTGGNHDFYMQANPVLIKDTAKELGIHYLQETSVHVEGLSIWGSPVTPNYGSMAFNLDRGRSLRRVWEQIPMDSDIILTHCPPMYIRDQVDRFNGKKEYTGCEDLASHIQHRKPTIHCFGHIHKNYGFTFFNGITFVNASVLNDDYEYVNEPITTYLEKENGKWVVNKIHEGLEN